MKNYKLLIFDIDGTLLDFHEAEKFGIKMTFKEFNFHYSDSLYEDYKNINASYWAQLEMGNYSKKEVIHLRFKTLFDKYNLEADIDKFNKCYKHHLSSVAYLIENALDILNHFNRDDEITMVILTNGFTSIQNERLKLLNLKMFFKDIFISESIGYNKPQREIFEHVFDKLGSTFRKDEALIIGDSLTSDIKGGLNFGIDTCWFNPEKNMNASDVKPTYEIDTLLKLKELIPSI